MQYQQFQSNKVTKADYRKNICYHRHPSSNISYHDVYGNIFY